MPGKKNESMISRPIAEGFFFKSRVQGRLFYTLLTIGLLPLLVTASISYLLARNTVKKEEGIQLRAIVEIRRGCWTSGITNGRRTSRTSPTASTSANARASK